MMRQGTTQFYYCCPTNFARQYKLVMKSIKKQKGNVLVMTDDPDKKCSGWDLNKWGFHAGCVKEKGSTRRLARPTVKNIGCCTITYEVP